MSENQVLDVFKQYRKMRTEAPPHLQKSAKEQKVRRLVKAWLQYLPREERFILYRRLVCELDCSEIVDAMRRLWGADGIRDSSSLLAKQVRAISRIIEFMDTYGVGLE